MEWKSHGKLDCEARPPWGKLYLRLSLGTSLSLQPLFNLCKGPRSWLGVRFAGMASLWGTFPASWALSAFLSALPPPSHPLPPGLRRTCVLHPLIYIIISRQPCGGVREIGGKSSRLSCVSQVVSLWCSISSPPSIPFWRNDSSGFICSHWKMLCFVSERLSHCVA